MTGDKRQIVVALTGSIGMGKSTVAAMFFDEGVAVWDADAAVHRLYSAGQAGALAIQEIVPAAVVDGAVDRRILSSAIRETPETLKHIEAAIHPLVAADRRDFIEQATTPVVLCDIPLLFENNNQNDFDAVIVVSAPLEIQQARVMLRDGMTLEKFEFIKSRQMPDADKRAKADFVVENGGTLPL